MGKTIICSQVAHDFISGEKKVEVLTQTNLTLREGEFVCIVGPSGCGKSTLLNVIAGLISPTEGQVTMDGSRITGPSPERGVIFQEFALMPWKTVLENVEFGLRMQRIPRSQRREIAMQYIQLVGLQGFENHYPYQLSGGMKQRTAIARAYAIRPEVLLMDEPFGALDAQTRAVLQEDLLVSWSQLKQTVLFITHDIDEAFFLGSRVLVMSARPGTIVDDIQVPFPYPRQNEIRFTTIFNDLKVRVWDRIQQEYHNQINNQ